MCLMNVLPPRTNRTDSLFPSTTLFRSSYRLYVEAIAARLGFDADIATDHLGQDLDYVRARIAGENCYDVAKLRMIQYWMAGKGVIRANSHIRAYSDRKSTRLNSSH